MIVYDCTTFFKCGDLLCIITTELCISVDNYCIIVNKIGWSDTDNNDANDAHAALGQSCTHPLATGMIVSI